MLLSYTIRIMTNLDIAKAFSSGEFAKTYNFIAKDARWTVVEENSFVGKDAIIENCEEVARYFKSVVTEFENLSIIAEDNKVAIHGTAKFFRNDKLLSFVSACDLYEFNDNNQIQNITSYCIPAK